MSLFNATAATAAPEHDAIVTTVQRYIDGYLGQEAKELRQAFHPDAKLMATEDGAVSAAATAAWFDRIEAKRQAGGSTLSAQSTVLGVDQAGDAAVAKVRLAFEAHTFTDYLALLKTAGGWQIVNKIYVSQPR